MLPPKMVPTGPAQIVWNQTSDACPGLNSHGHVGEQPDSMPIAWHNPLTNATSLISANDWGTFATVGPRLDALAAGAGQHDCSHRVYTSVNASLPWRFASHQWLQSQWMHPNGSGSALIHSEFHGGETGNTSLCSVQGNQGSSCQYWSTGLGTTSDGGATWALARAGPPEQNVVFAAPRLFAKDRPLTGFGAVGGMVEHTDGFYYGHVNQIDAGPANSSSNSSSSSSSSSNSSSSATSGVCAFRTNDLSDPKAFRGWNGTHWATTWVNPYKAASPQDLAAGDHTCTVISTGLDRNGHPSVREFGGSLARLPGWPTHLMLGWPEGGRRKVSYAFPAWQNAASAATAATTAGLAQPPPPPPAAAAAAAAAVASADAGAGGAEPFTAWGAAQYMDISDWLDPALFGSDPLMYPSLLARYLLTD